MTRQEQIRKLMLLQERTKRLAETDLRVFLQFYAWPVLQPGTKFVDNWHIGVICEHLEAVTSGQIKRLLINLPFRMLKSTIISQAFPAWEWIRYPHLQYLTASYAKDVATRDAVDSRRIIESNLYQDAWGAKFRMTSDQNVKTRYENDAKGSRVVTSTDAAGTGFGGNRIIVDDPVSALEADSETARAQSIEWWKGTAATRLNNPKDDAMIVVHQRLHQQDLTGYILAEEKGWEHLVLPMRLDPELRKTTSLGFMDPRKTKGELLSPGRLDEATVQEMESRLGVYHSNAQMQQNPSARGGNIFERRNWKVYKTIPEVDEYVISVDCSFKDTKSSDFVAIQTWGIKGANKYLLRRVRERLGFAATVTAVRAAKAMLPSTLAVLIEDKANGSAVIETLKNEIPGMVPINPDGGKVARAYAIQPEQEAGNLWLPDPSLDPQIEVYLTEVTSFPNVKNDDEVDATTQCINWIRRRNASSGLLDYYRDLANEAKREEHKAPTRTADMAHGGSSAHNFMRAFS
jgi:predicted phage terminase large subunit-like protein